MADDGSGDEDMKEATETPMEALRSAFGELSSEHQSVLRMRYLEPSSNREVAALLGRTEKAVEHLLRRARRELHRLAELRLGPDDGGRER